MILNLRAVPPAAIRLLALLLLLAGPAAAAETPETDPVAALRGALAAYDPSRAAESKARAADAFFLFETSKLDRDLALSSGAAYRDVEARWMRLVDDMGAGRPPEQVRADGEAIAAVLEDAARSGGREGGVFLDALLVILREGFEAILVVSALAAYLVRTGQQARSPYLYGGAGLAIAASFALWLGARTVFEVSGAAREGLEGATMLLATAVLFWVSYWLISKAEADRWQAFVRTQVEKAADRGALLGFGLLAFVVVFREGFETVLFYEAIAARASTAAARTMLGAGFATGAALLVVFYAAFLRLGPRIPLRTFFTVTGGLLYLMAFKFAGAGVTELQAAGWISRTRLDVVPDSSFLAGWLGISPYLEPVLAQAVLLAAAVAALWVALARPAPAEVGAAEPPRLRAS